MKKLLLFISILTMVAFTGGEERSTSVVITSGSKLQIIGRTNVHSFKCNYDILKIEKPIRVFYKRFNDKIIFDNTVLVLDNANFDCGGNAINADFEELIKTKTYPQIFIKLKEISKEPKINKQVLARLDINIAGVTKMYEIPVKIEGDDVLLMKGILYLNLNDFNLEPPKKALGLIVVKDVIDINFELAIKEY